MEALNLPAKDLLRRDEVAAYLAVTARCVDKWCKEGKLRRVGRRRAYRITRVSIVEFLEQASKKD